LLSGVWKKIFRCQQYANILWEKPYCCQKWGKNFPSPATSTGTCEHMFGFWLLSFSYANTHCAENRFIASGVQCSLAGHMGWRFTNTALRVFIAVKNLTAVVRSALPVARIVVLA